MKEPKFKSGATVKMINCGEAEHYEGREWVCDGDSFISSSGSEVVFLIGFSGYFICKYLIHITN